MDRPKIKLQLSGTDRLLEWLGLALLAGLWLMSVLTYADLPDQVPVHYNVRGEIDSWGSKNFIFVLAAIATAVYALLYFLNKSPHIFNYPVTITEENAEQQYRLATRLLRIISVLVIALFCWVQMQGVFFAARGIQSRMLVWQVPIIITVFPVVVIVYVIKASRAGKKAASTKLP